MRISEIIASLIPKVRPVKPTSPSQAEGISGTGYKKPDAVELSNESQLLSRLASEMKKMPEVDEARIMELKEKIEAGEYDPQSYDIAQKILGIESD